MYLREKETDIRIPVGPVGVLIVILAGIFSAIKIPQPEDVTLAGHIAFLTLLLSVLYYMVIALVAAIATDADVKVDWGAFVATITSIYPKPTKTFIVIKESTGAHYVYYKKWFWWWKWRYETHEDPAILLNKYRQFLAKTAVRNGPRDSRVDIVFDSRLQKKYNR